MIYSINLIFKMFVVTLEIIITPENNLNLHINKYAAFKCCNIRNYFYYKISEINLF